jgi:hypothetical protein
LEINLRELLPLAVFALVASLAVWGAIWLELPEIVNENHVIEYLQVAFLLAGFVSFLYLFYRCMPNPFGVLCLALSIFYLTFMVRELEPEETTTLFSIIVNPPVRNYWLTSCWVVALLFFLPQRKEVLKDFREWIKSRPGTSIIFAGVFYLTADLFDKQLLPLERVTNLFFEECLEFIGTIFMLLSAVLSISWSRQKDWVRRAKREAG